MSFYFSKILLQVTRRMLILPLSWDGNKRYTCCHREKIYVIQKLQWAISLIKVSVVSVLLYLGLFTQRYLLSTCPVLDTGHSKIKWYSVCPERSHRLVVRANETVSKFNIEQHLLPPRTICILWEDLMGGSRKSVGWSPEFSVGGVVKSGVGEWGKYKGNLEIF